LDTDSSSGIEAVIGSRPYRKPVRVAVSPDAEVDAPAWREHPRIHADVDAVHWLEIDSVPG
jgi:hypothetical protein